MGRGNPFGWRTKGFPLPKPHPFPKRALFRKMEAADEQRSPFAHSPPAHHKNDNKKARAASRLRCKKTAGRMASNTPPRVQKNIYLKTRPVPLQGKNEGSAKSTAKGKEPSSSPFPGNFQLSPRPHSGYTASDASILSKDLPASISPYIGGPAAKAARCIMRHCQKTIRAVFGGWGSLRGKGPFFRQKKGPSPSKPSIHSPDSPQ